MYCSSLPLSYIFGLCVHLDFHFALCFPGYPRAPKKDNSWLPGMLSHEHIHRGDSTEHAANNTFKLVCWHSYFTAWYGVKLFLARQNRTSTSDHFLSPTQHTSFIKPAKQKENLWCLKKQGERSEEMLLTYNNLWTVLVSSYCLPLLFSPEPFLEEVIGNVWLYCTFRQPLPPWPSPTAPPSGQTSWLYHYNRCFCIDRGGDKERGETWVEWAVEELICAAVGQQTVPVGLISGEG